MRWLLVITLCTSFTATFGAVECPHGLFRLGGVGLAFDMIESGNDDNLISYLKKKEIAPHCTNKRGENFFMFATRVQNQSALLSLRKIGFGPRSRQEYETVYRVLPDDAEGRALRVPHNIYDYVLRFGTLKQVSVAKKTGATMGPTYSQNSTELMVANLELRPDAAAITRSLLAQGHDVNDQGSDGKTALMVAAEFGNKESIIVLLAGGADRTLRDNLGKTAYDYAQPHLRYLVK